VLGKQSLKTIPAPAFSFTVVRSKISYTQQMTIQRPDTLQRTTVVLAPSNKLDEKHLRNPYLLSPYLQGVLMEHLNPEYANELHGQTVNPYSQSITAPAWRENKDSTLIWTINTLSSSAHEHFAKAIDSIQSGFELKATGYRFTLATKEVQTIETSELVKLCYDDSVSNRFTLNLLTPTSFKQQGGYVFTPDLRLILQSLQQKYNAIFEGSKEVDQEELDYIVSKTRILDYNLRSQYFRIGASNIPGFMGRLQFAVNGPQVMQGYVYMLLRFGEGSGLGIKTSMGMGAISCSQSNTKTSQSGAASTCG